MMKRLQLPILRGADRAFELEDGRRVLVQVRRRLLDASDSVAITFRVRPLGEDGGPLPDNAPCCPARTHTITQESLARGKVELASIIDSEVEAAIERWRHHGHALQAIADIEEDIDP